MPDVLIADDHPLFRDALRRAVMTALPDAQTHCADSVHTLLGLIDQFPEADLLLLDLHMLGLTGWEVLAEMAASGHSIPVIFITGDGDPALFEKAMSIGAAALLHKPFSEQQLLEAIAAVME